jgi:Icc protein
MRIAYLTDIHVQPERNAGEGLIACLRHVQQLTPLPDVVFNGGDAIMDAFEADESRTRRQWDLWHMIIHDECRLPIEHCLGNHDVWGWNRTKSGTTGLEPLHGKRWAMEAFGLRERFHSFDRAGWHFIFLDSTFPKGDAYEARLDEEQFDWLQSDLQAVSPATPILVVSHIPILSACAYFDGDNEKTGDWLVPGAWMHLDARRIKGLFSRHANVKLCLSGHIHLLDRVEYNGVTYLCNGAVSGQWWKGAYQECPPGYAVIDLRADGTFAHQYIPYDLEPSAR